MEFCQIFEYNDSDMNYCETEVTHDQIKTLKKEQRNNLIKKETIMFLLFIDNDLVMFLLFAIINSPLFIKEDIKFFYICFFLF